ncbi:MAG TPA: hypothetical protein VMM13_04390, partial [Euzebya sp.]|nr:hypothetical protein [Euzebya sp.]
MDQVTEVDAAALQRRVIQLARDLDPEVEVITIDPALADTAEFCAHYGYDMAQSGNCILVASR